MKKKIVVVGWTLLGTLLVMILMISVIAIMEGDGARPWKLVRGGKGGALFPAALLPILLAVILAGFFWLRRRLAKKISRNETTNPNE
jgi:uncharacterized membrane protein